MLTIKLQKDKKAFRWWQGVFQECCKINGCTYKGFEKSKERLPHYCGLFFEKYGKMLIAFKRLVRL